MRSRIDHDLQNLAKHWGIVKTNEATCNELRRVTARDENAEKNTTSIGSSKSWQLKSTRKTLNWH